MDRLQWVADNPTQADVSKFFDLIAMPFLQQGVIGHAIALVGAVWIASAVLRAPAQAKRL